jgi:hypothetical protein
VQTGGNNTSLRPALRKTWRHARALLGLTLAISLLAMPSAAEAKKSRSKAPTTTIEVIKGPPDAVSVKDVAAAAKAQALSDGSRLGVTVGNPSCAAPTKTTPGLVIQCLVPFGTSPIPYLVAIGAGSTLTARSTFPLVRASDMAAAAGDAIATCGAAVQSLPVGTVITCTIRTKKSSTTVQVQVADQNGLIKRVS